VPFRSPWSRAPTTHGTGLTSLSAVQAARRIRERTLNDKIPESRNKFICSRVETLCALPAHVSHPENQARRPPAPRRDVTSLAEVATCTPWKSSAQRSARAPATPPSQSPSFLSRRRLLPVVEYRRKGVGRRFVVDFRCAATTRLCKLITTCTELCSFREANYFINGRGVGRICLSAGRTPRTALCKAYKVSNECRGEASLRCVALCRVLSFARTFPNLCV